MQYTLLSSQCVCLTSYINYKVIKEHKEELSNREIIDFLHIFSNQDIFDKNALKHLKFGKLKIMPVWRERYVSDSLVRLYYFYFYVIHSLKKT